MISTVECPHCHRSFELTAALTGPIRASLSEELLAETVKRESELQTKQREIANIEADLLKRQAAVTAEIERQVNARQSETKDALRDEVRDEFARAIQEKDSKIASKTQSLSDAMVREKTLLDQKETLQQKLDEQELAVKRAVSVATENVRKEEGEKIKAKDGEHRLEMERINNQLKDAQRKLEQRSMEVQGEAAEIEMVASLRAWFQSDSIEDVPKGVRGADSIQRVMNHSGREVGAILWERKKTKRFEEAWIQKLKDDVTACKAHFGIILSDVLPKDIKGGFDSYKGVWFCSPADFEALAKALRASMIKEQGLIKAQEGKQTQGELLIDYVTSPLFKQRIESVSETFKAMQDQLQSEKKAMNKIWSAREGQIDRVFDALTGLAGDIESKIEKSLGLPSFELKALPEHTSN